MIQPSCWVEAGGARVTGLPSDTAPVVLSGVEVTWGRSTVFGQPDPATARVEVFDPTNGWAAGVDARTTTDLLHEHLDIGWAHAGAEHTLFRGRVTGVAIGPATLGGIDGTRVLIDATSRVADLANHIAPARGAETLLTRLIALQSAASAYLTAVDYLTVPAVAGVPAGVTPPADHSAQTLRPVPADTSTYAAIVALYDATASKLSYLPDIRQVMGVPRRKYPGNARGLAGLVRAAAGEARDGAGAFIASRGESTLYGQTGTSGATNPASRRLYLDGRTTVRPEEGWLSRAAEQRITRLDLTYRAATTYADTTLSVGVGRRMIPAGPSVQAATVETETVGVTDATRLADDYADSAASEGADWTPAPVVVDTAYTGGFDTLDQALDLLAGGETPSTVFLQRTDYPRLGQRPVFGVMGGVIGHHAGAWRVQLNLAPVFTSERQHPIAWDEIDDGTSANTVYLYADGTLNAADGLHESVTCEDLTYCSTGLGVTTEPADSGWDTYQ